MFGVAIVLFAITVASRFSWTAWPFELLSNFPVQLTAFGFALAILAILVRAKVTVLIALSCVVINVIVASSIFTDVRRTPRPDGERLRLGHLSAQTRPIDVSAFGDYVMAMHPDVFVILDPTQADVPRLTQAAPGFRVWRAAGNDPQNPGYVRAVVFSRAPIDDVRHPSEPDFGASAVELTIQTAAQPVSLIVFGTDSPTSPARTHRRDRALEAAARWSRNHPDRRVVMGDLNCTPWSPSFRSLLHDGNLFDSLDGFGLQASWPEWSPLLRIPIDHALLGPALAATDRGTGPSFGSEHRSVHVTIAPAR